MKLIATIVLIAILFSCGETPSKSKDKLNSEDEVSEDSYITDEEETSLNDAYQVFEKSMTNTKTKFLKTDINFYGGELLIKGGSKNLADIKYQYLKEKWMPELFVDYENDTSFLKLKLVKRENQINNDADNKCKISFNNKIPLELDVEFGAGKADLYLKDLNIKKADFAIGAGEVFIDLSGTSIPKLDVAAGVGEAKFDLSGEWKNDLDADFACGIGELTLILPAEVSTRVEIHGFLGDISAKGFTKVSRKVYTNDAYKKTEESLKIEIVAALGSVRLITK